MHACGTTVVVKGGRLGEEERGRVGLRERKGEEQKREREDKGEGLAYGGRRDREAGRKEACGGGGVDWKG